MALTVIARNRADGAASTRWDPIAARVTLRDEDGDSDGWEMPDGTLIKGSLRVPSPAKAAEGAARDAERIAARDKDDIARAAVKAEVTRIRAKAAGDRTVSERGFLGLAWLAFREE